MNLQELIETKIEMTVPEVKAFFLGAMLADKKPTFEKTFQELVAEIPESKNELEGPLRELWGSLEKSKKKELEDLFPENADIKKWVESTMEQLDFFLTSLSLAGTNSETTKNGRFGELIEELEDLVEDFEDYLADDTASNEDGEEMKEYLLSMWTEYFEEIK